MQTGERKKRIPEWEANGTRLQWGRVRGVANPAHHLLWNLHHSNMVLYQWTLIFGGAKSGEKLEKENEGTAGTWLLYLE